MISNNPQKSRFSVIFLCFRPFFHSTKFPNRSNFLSHPPRHMYYHFYEASCPKSEVRVDRDGNECHLMILRIPAGGHFEKWPPNFFPKWDFLRIFLGGTWDPYEHPWLVRFRLLIFSQICWPAHNLPLLTLHFGMQKDNLTSKNDLKSSLGTL